jgi:hypothetical protein
MNRPACNLDCGSPATGRGDYPYLCWSHTPSDEDSYPVLVTYTHEHVVWIAAPSAEDALRYAQQEAYEYTKDTETLVSADFTAALPKDEWDWDTVYDNAYGGTYAGLDCRAHVDSRTAWFNRIEYDHLYASIVNEDRDDIPQERRATCSACKQWRETGHEDDRHHQVMQRYADEDRARALAAKS